MEHSKTKSRSEESPCEKSMKFVSNIIRASSFSLASRPLGTTGKPAKDSPLPEREIAIEEPLLPKIPSGRRRLLRKPPREDGVDGLASEYIRRIRGKLGCGLLETGKPTT